MENKEFQTLIFSILFHILLGWLLLVGLPRWMPAPEMPLGPVEITVSDPASDKRLKKRQQSFVEETEQENLDNELRTQADLLSQLNKRVRDQMKAANNGETANRGRGHSPVTPTQNNKSESRELQKKKSEKHADLRGLTPEMPSSLAPTLPKPGERQTMDDQSPRMESSGGIGRFSVIGESSIAEHIPGVKEGGFTALNTDQFLFYSFFSRLNREIRPRWVSRIRNYTDALTPPMLQHLAQTPSITNVEIVLNSQGYFQKAIVHKSSGDTNLDRAATDSFKDAAPFLNPPAELIEKDQTIRLHYSFYVEWRG